MARPQFLGLFVIIVVCWSGQCVDGQTLDCGSLTDPANGRVDHTAGTTFGQTATYSCNTGYNLVGDNTRTCGATREWSGSEPTCQMDPPMIIEHPQDMFNVTPGTNAVFTVVASGSQLNYTWMYGNGEPLSSDRRYVTVNGTLTIPIVEQMDTGSYRCLVTNAAGNATSDSANLTLSAGKVGFTFKGEALDNNALVTTEDIGEGDNALRCMTDNTSCCRRPYTSSLGQQALGNWWFPNGTRVPSSGVRWDMHRTRGHMVVLLQRRRGGVDGVYSCVVPDKDGIDQSAYIGVYIEGAGQVTIEDEITFKLDTDPVTDPPVFTLTTTSTGGPPSTVSWSRDGTLLSDDSTYRIAFQVINGTTATYTHTLTVTGRLEGEYEFNVSNIRTPSPSTSSLTVVAADSPTNVNAVLNNVTSITVSWTPPASVSGYEVYWSGGGGADTGNMSVAADDTAVTISGLTPGLAYDITLVALSDQLPSPVTVVTVTLVDPPMIIEHPQDMFNVTPGTNATFTVVAIGLRLTYTWMYGDGEPLSNRRYVTVNGTLTIPIVQQTDTGSYRCLVTNEAGNATSQSANLTLSLGEVGFTFKGAVLNNNSLVTAEDIGEGDNALRCMTDNTSCCRRPYTTLLGRRALGNWFFPNGTRVPSSGSQWDFHRTRGHMVVLLQRRRGGEDGVYRCVLPDKDGNDQSTYIGVYTASGMGQVTIEDEMTFQLDTDPATDPPVFTLTTTSTGGPPSTVSWSRDGTLLNDDSTYSIAFQVINGTTSTYTHTLTVTGRLEGEYEFNVSNIRTPSPSTSSLTVVAADSPTIISAVQVNVTSITVSWTPPATVSGYEVYWSGGGGADTGNMSVGADDTAVTISGLTPGFTYEITLVALSENLPSPAVAVTVILGVHCGVLTNPTNGQVSSNGTTFGETATYSCNTGYNLVGDNTRTCEAAGAWSGNAPTCQPVDCNALSDPANGQVSTNGTTFGETATYSCNTGYNLVGDNTRTCGATGNWSGSAPTCELVDCNALSDPANGQVSTTGTTLGETATYSCNTGYNLVGDNTRTCGAAGNWSGSEPTCELVDCNALPDPANGQVSTSGTTFGETATYSCNTGYNLVGNSTRTCQATGNWSGSEPTCELVDCIALSDPANGQVSTSGTTFLETATYSCNTGYNLVGDNTRTCQATGNWSGSEPTCEPVDCNALSDPANGQVSTSGTTFGETATYSCNPGYNLVGDNTRTCQATGNWSGSAPTCEPVDCNALSDPANGQVSTNGTTLGETATYNCNTGYNLVGDNTRTCQATGNWSGSAPTCQPVDCDALSDPANGQVSTNGATFGENATYSCNTGYNLVGDSTRTCQATGNWSGSAPTCQSVDCDTLSDPANGQVSTNGATFGENATYSCNTGYNLVGDSTRTCQATGNWSGSAPTCQPVYCDTLSDPANGQVSTNGTTLGETATYNCNTGYNLVGDNTRTCQATGNWSGSAPTCQLVDCNALSDPANGQVSTNGATFGENATYSCNTGYNLVGDSTRTCQATGNWSGSTPTCQPVDCNALSDPANGQVSTNGATFGENATYSCNTGYNLLGDSTRTCQATGNWSGSAPTCQPVDCDTLSDPANGQVNTNGATFGENATYSCNTGYNLVGDTTRTCGATGNWSGSAPTCQPVDCDTLSDPANGQVSTTGTTFEQTATYSCDTGYNLVGDNTRTCETAGEWSGSAPTCQPVDCGNLTNPENGEVDHAEGTTFGQTATYSCDGSFDLEGDSNRTCQDTGNWSGSEPTCRPPGGQGGLATELPIPEEIRFSLNGAVYQNNSLVTLEDIGEGDDALLCMTDQLACCRPPYTGAMGGVRGNWYFPNGTIVPIETVNSTTNDQWDFYSTRGDSVLSLHRRRDGEDGVYRCVIPDASNVTQTLYVGVYTTNIGLPSVTSITFNAQSNSFICSSTGGSAETVTWRRNGVVIPNQQTKIVMNTTTSTYQTVLTIDPSQGQSDIVGTYSCTVENARGISSRMLVLTDVTVTFRKQMYMLMENDGMGTVCIDKLNTTSETIQIMISGALQQGLGSIDQIVTFAPEQNASCVDFLISDDDLALEPMETLTFTLSNLDNESHVFFGTYSTAYVGIMDDDELLLSLVKTTDIPENIGTTDVCIEFSHQFGQPFQINVQSMVPPVFNITGTIAGTPNVDYIAINQTINATLMDSAAGETCISLSVLDDTVLEEPLECLLLRIQIPDDAPDMLGIAPDLLGIAPGNDSTLCCIMDDDNVTIGFEQTTYNTTEGVPTEACAVVLSDQLEKTVVVSVSSSNDTATVDDYFPINAELTFSSTMRRQCVNVTTKVDAVALETEAFSLVLSAFGQNVAFATSTATVNVTENLDPMNMSVVNVRFVQPEYTFNEDGGRATVCLTKDLETGVNFTVFVFTINGSALDGEDYIGGSFPVTLARQVDAQQCISITILPDSVRERQENFNISIQLPDNLPQVQTGIPATATVFIEDGGIRVNDTVIGDPLITVPVLVQGSDLAQLGDGGVERLSLCYEVHGRPREYFNFVTDDCASVNAHYIDLTADLNIIDRVGIRAVESGGNRQCRNISVDLSGCSAMIDGRPLNQSVRYNVRGIRVRQYPRRVRVAVPNCNDLSLVIWVICQNNTVDDRINGGKITAEMIKIAVMRGLNLGHRNAHGIMGQFWNVPVRVSPYTGEIEPWNSTEVHYVVNVTRPGTNNVASFTGLLFDYTWESEKGPCLYVGDSQGGSVREIQNPNDRVLDGSSYRDYIVPNLFSESGYQFSRFDASQCN